MKLTNYSLGGGLMMIIMGLAAMVYVSLRASKSGDSLYAVQPYTLILFGLQVSITALQIILKTSTDCEVGHNDFVNVCHLLIHQVITSGQRASIRQSDYRMDGACQFNCASIPAFQVSKSRYGSKIASAILGVCSYIHFAYNFIRGDFLCRLFCNPCPLDRPGDENLR